MVCDTQYMRFANKKGLSSFFILQKFFYRMENMDNVTDYNNTRYRVLL